MITRQELEGSWNSVKGKLQERWGQLTDNDLTQFKGDANQLIGAIQAKTGETRRAVEDFLQSAMKNSGSAVQQAVSTAKDYAGQAKQVAGERYEQALEGVQVGMKEAEAMVRRSPMESVAVAFGAGLIAGVVAGLVLKSSRA
ncbi:hypothetical protein Pan44_28760 [Caulifigura coniformis]|uniref:CsbD-like domain-containing protein n=1 Tax=Caulifigura coniformis TaxID=2527983 RepID=A0A517SFF2_9PLAN|nr:CsbD family protein [Caulifigura coniformis]QDT54838.1 hypothetical protein Pan44_28760 [Caulifigura coniformis]